MMDIDQMRDEVQGIARDTSAERRRDRYNAALITTLLDVAESLRVLAAESEAAMHPMTVTQHIEMPTDDDAIVVGSVVYAEHIDGPGEVKGFGETEGKMYAEVDFGGDNFFKVWVDALHLLTGDEGDEPDPLAEVIIEPEVLHISDSGKEAIARAVEQVTSVAPAGPDPETDFDVDPLDNLKRKAAARKKKGTEK